MKNNLQFLVFSLATALCTSAKLPPSFKTCNRKKSDFNACLSDAIENAIRQLNTPFKEIGLPSLSPLEIPSLTIGAGHGAVAFEQNYKNVKVSGLGTVRCPKAEMNFETNTFLVDCVIPVSKMEFDYEINGKILLLPIYGKGPGSITLNQLHHTVTFNLEEYTKKSKTFYRVVSSKVTMEPQSITFDLKNLFNGEKALSDMILLVLNENWKEVFGDVQTSYEEAFGQVFSSIFNNMLGRVPASEIFVEE